MPRTGENIYKRKDGRWEARYISSYDENGKAKYRYLYVQTYIEVKNKLLKEQTTNQCIYKTDFDTPNAKRFKSYLKQAMITDATFHSLRHTFATRCVEVGFDVKTLREILGYSSVKS